MTSDIKWLSSLLNSDQNSNQILKWGRWLKKRMKNNWSSHTSYRLPPDNPIPVWGTKSFGVTLKQRLHKQYHKWLHIWYFNTCSILTREVITKVVQLHKCIYSIVVSNRSPVTILHELGFHSCSWLMWSLIVWKRLLSPIPPSSFFSI